MLNEKCQITPTAEKGLIRILRKTRARIISLQSKINLRKDEIFGFLRIKIAISYIKQNYVITN